MSRLSRRHFLKSSFAAAGAGILINGTKATGNFFGANETIRIGVAGINGRGGSHIDAFGKMQDVKITYLIDPDTRLFKSRGQKAAKADGEAPKMITDVRKALEDKDLDAISIATPIWCITIGTGSGILATATSATRACTRWTRPAGEFPARRCPKASSASADASAMRIRARRPTRRSPYSITATRSSSSKCAG